jgi:hypothetical protein
MSLEEANAGSEPENIDDTEIEEDRLLEMLSKLRLEIFRIETTTGPSQRTVSIQNEIRRLESQLASCKT